MHQPLQKVYEGLPGFGGVSPGFHVFMLNEHGGQTVVTILMNHASVMEDSSRTERMTAEDALRPWCDETAAPEWHRKWRDDFIPALKTLVYEGKQNNCGM
jgi:hypothetical protein